MNFEMTTLLSMSNQYRSLLFAKAATIFGQRFSKTVLIAIAEEMDLWVTVEIEVSLCLFHTNIVVFARRSYCFKHSF